MRKIIFALLLVAAPVMARAQIAGDPTQAVATLVAAAAGCPVSLSLGSWTDPTTWSASYGANCTAGEISAGNAALSSFNLTAWEAGQSAVATYNAAIKAGLAVTSTATPSLDATYALDAKTQFNITAEVVSIGLNSAFTNGAGSKAWPDAAGNFHTFTVAQFKTFATAVAQYLDALAMTEQALALGQSASWPAPSAAIP